MIEGSKGSH